MLNEREQAWAWARVVLNEREQVRVSGASGVERACVWAVLNEHKRVRAGAGGRGHERCWTGRQETAEDDGRQWETMGGAKEYEWETYRKGVSTSRVERARTSAHGRGREPDGTRRRSRVVLNEYKRKPC